MRRNCSRGSAMVELALSMVALVPLAYGVLSYGTSYLVQADLANAVRAGARYGSMLALKTSDLAGFKEAVKLRTAEGTPGGLAARGVEVEVEFERGAPARIKVTAVAQRSRSTAVFPYLGEWEK